MSIDFKPSKNYPGRTDLHHRTYDDSNSTTIISLTADDLQAIEQYVTMPAGTTAYDCPQHDDCDGGCGVRYRGRDARLAIRKALDEHTQSVRNERCACGWRPDYSKDRLQDPASAQHREHITEVIFGKVTEAL